LVRRIMSGDRLAEAELVERYHDGVRILLRRELGETAIAADLYQETFRLVLERIRRGEVREPEKLPGFICSVARNLAINYFRQVSRQERLTENEDLLHLPSHAPDQLEELLRKERADLVLQVLKEMPNERDVQVLFRFYLAEDEKDQICADLGLNRIYFNLVIHRARQRFKELYEKALKGL
ncbi:MAG: sigma-70 family RNA polymerase sigma factor, partial [Blastocatellia bacterium]|nr:sigma-70 family RNA polymerase sigma factor [Blastocatellia bacterium]